MVTSEVSGALPVASRKKLELCPPGAYKQFPKILTLNFGHNPHTTITTQSEQEKSIHQVSRGDEGKVNSLGLEISPQQKQASHLRALIVANPIQILHKRIVVRQEIIGWLGDTTVLIEPSNVTLILLNTVTLIFWTQVEAF